MRIVAVSDSHASRTPLSVIRNRFPDADLFIHCGDSCLPKSFLDGYVAVEGNCDQSGLFPNGTIVEKGGHRILVLHGHVLFDSDDPKPEKVAECARRNGCDIAFFGHSHQYFSGVLDGVHVYNPGALSRDRGVEEACFIVVDIVEGAFREQKYVYELQGSVREA